MSRKSPGTILKRLTVISKTSSLIRTFRSGLEREIAAQISREGLPINYESFKIPFVQPEQNRTYTPDFLLPNGIIIESKGKFEVKDRQKHLWVASQYPDLDIRFVFTNPNQRISKNSKTTYGAWCRKYGFKYAKKLIPQAWLEEPVNQKSLKMCKELKGK